MAETTKVDARVFREGEYNVAIKVGKIEITDKDGVFRVEMNTRGACRVEREYSLNGAANKDVDLSWIIGNNGETLEVVGVFGKNNALESVDIVMRYERLRLNREGRMGGQMATIVEGHDYPKPTERFISQVISVFRGLEKEIAQLKENPEISEWLNGQCIRGTFMDAVKIHSG